VPPQGRPGQDPNQSDRSNTSRRQNTSYESRGPNRSTYTHASEERPDQDPNHSTRSSNHNWNRDTSNASRGRNHSGQTREESFRGYGSHGEHSFNSQDSNVSGGFGPNDRSYQSGHTREDSFHGPGYHGEDSFHSQGSHFGGGTQRDEFPMPHGGQWNDNEGRPNERFGRAASSQPTRVATPQARSHYPRSRPDENAPGTENEQDAEPFYSPEEPIPNETSQEHAEPPLGVDFDHEANGHGRNGGSSAANSAGGVLPDVIIPQPPNENQNETPDDEGNKSPFAGTNSAAGANDNTKDKENSSGSNVDSKIPAVDLNGTVPSRGQRPPPAATGNFDNSPKIAANAKSGSDSSPPPAETNNRNSTHRGDTSATFIGRPTNAAAQASARRPTTRNATASDAPAMTGSRRSTRQPKAPQRWEP